jgi:hypothetical protein
MMALPKVTYFSDPEVVNQASLELQGPDIMEASFVKLALDGPVTGQGWTMQVRVPQAVKLQNYLQRLIRLDEAVDLLERQLEDGNVQSYVRQAVAELSHACEAAQTLADTERLRWLATLSVDRAQRALARTQKVSG